VNFAIHYAINDLTNHVVTTVPKVEEARIGMLTPAAYWLKQQFTTKALR